jgi:hypothetical protein
MFGLVQEDKYSHNESAPARIVRDNKDEESLISVFEQHHVFSPTSHPECLFSIATKDLATFEIHESLLGAKDMGQKQVKDFVQQRLTEPLQQQLNNEQGDTKVQFTDTMHKNNALTFDSFYQVAKEGKEKEKNTILRADRSVLQRLIVAYGAGREVDLHNILSHELMSVSISLADTNGKLLLFCCVKFFLNFASFTLLHSSRGPPTLGGPRGFPVWAHSSYATACHHGSLK